MAAIPKNPLDLTSQAFLDDPYATYDRLRRELPVSFDERLGYWLVARYADVHALLRDDRMSSTARASGSGFITMPGPPPNA